MLSVLGLGATEEAVYRQLVARADATVDELAAATGQAPEAVQDTLDRLVARGLAVTGAGGAVAAAPPAVALGALVRQVGDDLREAERDLVRLADQHRAATLALPSVGVVEVITDVDAVRHRFAQIQESARHDIRSMMVPDLAVVPAAVNAAGDSCLVRGVRYRSILDRVALGRPGVVQEALASLDDGEDIRIADRVPVKMIIADESCAMLPLLPGQNTAAASLLIHPSGTLDALIAYFEIAWSHSYPLRADPTAGTVSEVRPAEPDVLDRQILSLLLAGLTDDTVANQLGTSVRTVQRRVHQLSLAAGAKTRMQLGWHAARHGWA